MITVKVKNCKYKNRNNQNTNFFFSERNYGFDKDEIVTADWVLQNLSIIKKDIEKQNNTKIEIKQIQSGGGIGETLLYYGGEVKETHTGSNPVLTTKK